MTTESDHTPEPWFWEAGSEECPHGPQPDYETDGEAFDVWSDQHPSSPQGVRICRDAPAGDACSECSEDNGEMVPWSACRFRDRARPQPTPSGAPQHRPVTATVGTQECLEQECDDFFTEDGDEIPGKETCSHMRRMEICEACSEPGAAEDYPAVVAWADCARRNAKAGSAA